MDWRGRRLLHYRCRSIDRFCALRDIRAVFGLAGRDANPIRCVIRPFGEKENATQHHIVSFFFFH